MDQEEKSTNEDLVYGVVEEALPNAMFRVTLDDTGELILAYLSG
jgi:translation initiation factor IF-1